MLYSRAGLPEGFGAVSADGFAVAASQQEPGPLSALSALSVLLQLLQLLALAEALLMTFELWAEEQQRLRQLRAWQPRHQHHRQASTS